MDATKPRWRDVKVVHTNPIDAICDKYQLDKENTTESYNIELLNDAVKCIAMMEHELDERVNIRKVAMTFGVMEEILKWAVRNERQKIKHADKGHNKHDAVSHPSHYCKGGVECLDAIKAALGDKYEGFLAGNVLKYVYRYPDKNGVEDCKKAAYYLQKLIELKEGAEHVGGGTCD